MSLGGGFRAIEADIDETEPFPFSFLVVLFQSRDAGPPTADDADYWAGATGLSTPVLSDPSQNFTNLVPFEGAIPHRCAVTPRMEMIDCYTGEGSERAVQAIRDHWEESGG